MVSFILSTLEALDKHRYDRSGHLKTEKIDNTLDKLYSRVFPVDSKELEEVNFVESFLINLNSFLNLLKLKVCSFINFRVVKRRSSNYYAIGQLLHIELVRIERWSSFVF